eukprot:NODE_3924_length_728_cov_241.933135.p7 GENE.NODE_3924_length_728_cov_241.933135~~NODE_3924_length_728_cov_241.933135.p7  ORF type:complete len:61 (-),score=44.34 NODE_3924_length_728_cov_241.933135:2-184(-)
MQAPTILLSERVTHFWNRGRLVGRSSAHWLRRHSGCLEMRWCRRKKKKKKKKKKQNKKKK